MGLNIFLLPFKNELIFLARMPKRFWVYKNSFAMNQMSYSFDSNLALQVYDYISNYSWIAYILLTILVFRKEILKLYKNIKEKKEKTNEQI